jgi:predicted nucleic acid-binding protein
MARKTESYADTSAFIAFLDRSDSHHRLFARLFADPPPLVTSPLVIAEGHAWFLRRYDAFRALQFHAFIEDLPALRVLPIGPGDIKEAAKYLRRFSGEGLTLADAVGLHLMARRSIRSCWATDPHLGLTGVPLAIRSRA